MPADTIRVDLELAAAVVRVSRRATLPVPGGAQLLLLAAPVVLPVVVRAGHDEPQVPRDLLPMHLTVRLPHQGIRHRHPLVFRRQVLAELVPQLPGGPLHLRCDQAGHLRGEVGGWREPGHSYSTSGGSSTAATPM